MSHSIVGWTDRYEPIEDITDPEGPNYKVTCTCGRVITGWNQAVCGGLAAQHVRMSNAARELFEMRRSLEPHQEG
jgi:hypothetical protein